MSSYHGQEGKRRPLHFTHPKPGNLPFSTSIKPFIPLPSGIYQGQVQLQEEDALFQAFWNHAFLARSDALSAACTPMPQVSHLGFLCTG